jgi:hypothetical protein
MLDVRDTRPKDGKHALSIHGVTHDELRPNEIVENEPCRATMGQPLRIPIKAREAMIQMPEHLSAIDVARDREPISGQYQQKMRGGLIMR